MSTTERAASAGVGVEPGFRVIWLGERPPWLEDSSVRAELDDVEPGPPRRRPRPFVVHARASALPALRCAENDRLVADLSGCTRLDRVSRRVAARAAAVVVDDPQQLRLLGSDRRGRAVLIRPPIDPAANGRLAPVDGSDRELRRFRRLHRLTDRTLLYVGPYRPEGGLHLLLEIVETLRRQWDDLVLAAIPDGPVDRRYRDRCERRALGLGHRAVIEWSVSPRERACWYAAAAAVCVPSARPVESHAAVRAAAFGVPLVAPAVEPFLELPGDPGQAPPAARDPAGLTTLLRTLLADPASARAAGDESRRSLEDALAPAAVARRLRHLWSSLVADGSGPAAPPRG